MAHFAQDMKRLGLAYYFTGKAAYAQKAAELATAWFVTPKTKMNPNLAYAQAIPGIVDGRGIGIIDSRALIDVMDSIELIRPANTLSEENYQSIKSWYKEFNQWLLTSNNGFEESNWHNNHGTFLILRSWPSRCYRSARSRSPPIENCGIAPSSGADR